MFLTAAGGQDARVRGLALGADDYVVKPFSMRELILRVRGGAAAGDARSRCSCRRSGFGCRDQFRVWNRYAEIHLARGEWRDCLELSRSILHNCDGVLSPDERRRDLQRIARCAQELGDTEAQKTWQGKAESL